MKKRQLVRNEGSHKAAKFWWKNQFWNAGKCLRRNCQLTQAMAAKFFFFFYRYQRWQVPAGSTFCSRRGESNPTPVRVLVVSTLISGTGHDVILWTMYVMLNSMILKLNILWPCVAGQFTLVFYFCWKRILFRIFALKQTFLLLTIFCSIIFMLKTSCILYLQ